MQEHNPHNVEKYIDDFPEHTKELLQQMRSTIMKAAPDAEEVISYKMPAYRLNGMLVYFAGYKNHIGFYPTGSAIKTFKDELSIYKGAKGSVQFPINKPLPLELVMRMVAFRVKENMEKATVKLKIKRAKAVPKK